MMFLVPRRKKKMQMAPIQRKTRFSMTTIDARSMHRIKGALRHWMRSEPATIPAVPILQVRAIGRVNCLTRDSVRPDRTSIRATTGRLARQKMDLQRTQNVLNPYIEQGRRAQGVYDTALGLEGADAQREYYDQLNEEFTNDPVVSFSAIRSTNRSRGSRRHQVSEADDWRLPTRAATRNLQTAFEPIA